MKTDAPSVSSLQQRNADSESLSPSEHAEAETLFRQARALGLSPAEREAALMIFYQAKVFRASGAREAILKLDDAWAMCAVGRRIDTVRAEVKQVKAKLASLAAS